MALANTSDEQVDWNDPASEDVDWNSSPKSDYAWHAAPARDPTEGMSTMDKVMAGAGKAQVDAWRGIKQLFGADNQDEIDEAAKNDAPLMRTGAGLAGYGGGVVADAVIPAGLAGNAARAAGLTRTAGALGELANPSTFGAAAAAGAAQGAIQPVATGDSRGWNALSGAAAGGVGQGLARGASALVAAGSDALSTAGNKAAEALVNAGVPLDAAQRTGSILLQRAKAMLSDNPLTAGAQKDFEDMQSRAFTKAALATIGAKADAATPEVMAGTMKRLGAVYDDISSRVNIPYDTVEAKLADIENQSRLTLDDQQFGKVQRNLNDILQKASQNGGVIDGAQFANIKHTLDKISGSADTDVGEVARDIRETLHDGLLQSAAASGNQADVTALKTANQQWGNMRKIEGAIAKDGSGQIRPASLANTMYQKGNRYISIYGRGDTSLADLADAGNALLPNKTPNSGTPSRILAQIAAPAALGAGIEGIREGNWQGAAKGAVAGVAIPYAAQYALNSQGQVAGRAMNAAAALGSRTNLPQLAGGTLQKSPWATLLGLEAGLDKSKKGQSATQ